MLLFYFIIISAALFLLFRPQKGYFYVIKNALIQNEKTNIEDILKQLYHIEYQGRTASLDSLSGVLKMDYKQLVKLITIMESNDLLKSSSSEIQLLQTGRDYALKVIRVHRLWEKYLSEETGFDKSEWHFRAEQMEHQLNPQEANSLAFKLGNPRFDPHGDPIPTAKGEIATIESQPLSSLKSGAIAKVVHIEDEPAVIYEQIIAENIDLGTRIRVAEVSKERIRFFTEGEEHVLAPVVAANIGVLVLDKEKITPNNTQRLSNLGMEKTAIIKGISRECRGANRRRLLDLGFVPNTEVSISMSSPMNDPKAYLIRDTIIALRNDQAKYILIEKTQ